MSIVLIKILIDFYKFKKCVNIFGMDEIVKNKLKNCRKSKNRDCVIEILESASSPISVEDIFYILKKKNKKLALSTVYRIIEKLIYLGIVQESIKDDERAMYELVQNGHRHYLICTKCKKVVPVDVCPFSDVENHISKESGFKITGHKFEIYGECPKCRANN